MYVDLYAGRIKRGIYCQDYGLKLCSIESLSLELGLSKLLMGTNNTGKTNFLKALNLAVSGWRIQKRYIRCAW